MTIIVQDKTSLRQFNLKLAMRSDAPFIDVRDYMARHYPNLHIVGRA